MRKLHWILKRKNGTEEFDETSLHMRQLLKTKLVDMDLSVRALNCLKAADVETLGDLYLSTNMIC
jgi:DNA-directed RNA polymerase subunit alpha